MIKELHYAKEKLAAHKLLLAAQEASATLGLGFIIKPRPIQPIIRRLEAEVSRLQDLV